MGDTVKPLVDGDEFQAVREDIDKLRKDLAQLVGQVKSDALQNIASRVEGMSDDARRLYDRAVARGERGADALAHRVEEQPLTSVLIAFALGFIGGRLILR